MKICETCKYNNKSITMEPCYSCKPDQNQSGNWEPMNKIKDSGDRTEFQSGAVRDMHEGKGRCDLLPPNALLRLARHFEEGCLKYGDRNWEKGIPCSSFLDSALRHLFKYMAGEKDEAHEVAALWNIICLIETEIKRPEMQDIPGRMEDVR